MQYATLLKRALEVPWRQRSLWLVGALVALSVSLEADIRQWADLLESWRQGTLQPASLWGLLSGIEGSVAGTAGWTGLATAWQACAFVARVLLAGVLIAAVDGQRWGRANNLQRALRAVWERLPQLVGIGLLLEAVNRATSNLLADTALPPSLWASQRGADWLGCALLPLAGLATIVVTTAASMVARLAERECLLRCPDLLAALKKALQLLRGNAMRVTGMWLLLSVAGLVFQLAQTVVFTLGLVAIRELARQAGPAWPSTPTPIAAVLLVYLATAAAITALAGFLTAFESAAWTFAYYRLTSRAQPAPGSASVQMEPAS